MDEEGLLAMTPIQLRLLQMLEEIDVICYKHGITYYAAGGTALGAIRHGGFIPWDDDVDLMMPRDDWKRFVEVAREGLPPNRVLSCIEVFENYPHVFGRYTDTTTCSIHYNQFLGGAPEGLVIDIFILDTIPDADASFRAHREVLALYTDLANPLGYSYPMSTSSEKLRFYESRIITEGRVPVLRELANQLERFDDNAGDYMVMRWAAAPRLFHRSIFGFPRKEKFEHLKINVPSRLNDYLVQHYGDDWEQLPPVAERVTHDAITFTDVDYQTVLDDYLPFVDVERTRKAILRRRRYHIDHMDELNRIEDLRAQILAQFAQAVTNLSASENHGNSNEDERFATFIRIQSLSEVSGREEYRAVRRYFNPVSVKLDENDFCDVVRLLADTNRMGLAARFLEVREQSLGGLSSAERDVRNSLEAVRLPRSLRDIGCEDEAFELSRYLLNRFPRNYSNRLFMLEELARRGKWDELQKVAERGLEQFPKSGEYMKFLADAAIERSRVGEDARRASNHKDIKADARSLYAQAVKNTANSFIRRDAFDKLRLIDSQRTSCLEEPHVNSISGAYGESCDADIDLLHCGKKALALLEELVELCAEADIRYFLGPISCYIALACEPGAIPSPELDVLVPANDLMRLTLLLMGINRADRAVDCWLTNGCYPAFTVDYVDTSTTFLQLDEGTDVGSPGVRVRIVPLRSKGGGSQNSFFDELEQGWELNGYRLAKRFNKQKVIAAAKARVFMLGGRARAARILFSHLTHDTPFPGQTIVVLRLPGQEPIAMPASLFSGGTSSQANLSRDVDDRGNGSVPAVDNEAIADGPKNDKKENASELELGGILFAAPLSPHALLDSVYGVSWRETLQSFLKRHKSALLCADLPYGDFLGMLEDEGCPVSELFEVTRRVRWGMIPLAIDLQTRNHAMLVAERSRDRKLWCDRLDAQWPTIMALLGNNRIDEDNESIELKTDGANGEETSLVTLANMEALSRIYAGYEKDARRYLKAGLGLCPSKRHKDMLCAILRARCDAATADELERLSPEQHYAPLGKRSSVSSN